MTEHPYNEGDRVIAGRRTGTVSQVSDSQPHIAWVQWDDGPLGMVGTAHLTKDEATSED
jgi:hypothetical protein